jgi:PH (Pleckstrin Homology) domain-containing protein
VNELDRNLLTGEQIIFETKKHWFAPIRTSLIAILILLGALVLRVIAPGGGPVLGFLGNLMDLVSTVLLLVGIVWVGYNIVEWLSAHFGVTNMRVLRYEGLLRRSSSETLLKTLTDVRLEEPAIGRMLGFGNLRILTASGRAGEDDWRTVAKARELRTAHSLKPPPPPLQRLPRMPRLLHLPRWLPPPTPPPRSPPSTTCARRA